MSAEAEQLWSRLPRPYRWCGVLPSNDTVRYVLVTSSAEAVRILRALFPVEHLQCYSNKVMLPKLDFFDAAGKEAASYNISMQSLLVFAPAHRREWAPVFKSHLDRAATNDINEAKEPPVPEAAAAEPVKGWVCGNSEGVYTHTGDRTTVWLTCAEAEADAAEFMIIQLEEVRGGHRSLAEVDLTVAAEEVDYYPSQNKVVYEDGREAPAILDRAEAQTKSLPAGG